MSACLPTTPLSFAAVDTHDTFPLGKADVWAAGALVYAMAVGDPAPAELATASRPELVSVVGHQTGSDGLALAAHRALDPDPSARPSAHQVWGRRWALTRDVSMSCTTKCRFGTVLFLCVSSFDCC